MKHFHSQNWKQKEIKKKEIELLSYNHFNQIVSLSLPVSHEKIKACQLLLRKPPKLTY